MSTEKISTVSLNKVLITIGFILFCAAAITIARMSSAATYEISIYQAYPFYFWIFIVTSLLCGIGVLIRESLITQNQRSLYLVSFVLVILCNLTILLLPTFRGYYIDGRVDTITHIGYVIDILNTGHFGTTNFYPISHILSTQIILIGGIDTNFVMNITPICLYGIYSLGLFILARCITTKPKATYLILAFGAVLLFNYFNYLFMPTQHILFVLPFVLYLYIKIRSPNSWGHNISLIVFLLGLTFIHPLGTLFICALLIFINWSLSLHKHHDNTQNGTLPLYKSNWTTIILLFMLFFMWFSNFFLFKHSAKQAFKALLLGEGRSPIQDITEGAASANYSLVDTIIRIMKNDGQHILFALLGLIAIFMLVKKYRSRNASLTSNEIFLSFFFIAFGLFSVASIISPFLGTGASVRLFCWPLFASILLNGIVYEDWISRATGMIKKIGISAICLVIFISTFIGILNTFFSPIIDNGDVQVTRAEWYSLRWFISHKIALRTFTFSQLPERATDGILGTDAARPSSVGYFYDVPEHMGYDKSDSAKDTMDNSYIVIGEGEKAIKQQINPTSGKYTLEEMYRLYSDPAISLVYSCRGTDILLVKG